MLSSESLNLIKQQSASANQKPKIMNEDLKKQLIALPLTDYIKILQGIHRLEIAKFNRSLTSDMIKEQAQESGHVDLFLQCYTMQLSKEDWTI